MNIYDTLPKNFAPKISVVGVYCLCDNEVLMLKRHPACSYGNYWCLPGGKLEDQETLQEGALRELLEETGVVLTLDEIVLLKDFYFDQSGSQYTFTVYFSSFFEKPDLTIALREHTDSKWVPVDDFSHYQLIPGGNIVLQECWKAIHTPDLS